MEVIFNKICVLVTATLALTLVLGSMRSEGSLLSMPGRGTTLIVFLLLGLVEEAVVRQTGWFNHRIVVVTSASLLAGLGVGVLVRLFVIWLAFTYDGLPLFTVAILITSAGLLGGFIYRWRPALAQRPLTGFCLTFAVSLLRNSSTFFYAPGVGATLQTFADLAIAPVLQGLGTALILAIVAQVRERDERTRAATAAEVRALQARMNPHFLFNALNAVAALATVAPREIPRAVGRLRHFLGASFNQHERPLVSLREELTVVRAYLEIESLRFGARLKVEEAIDSGLEEFLVPPFSLQPLLENAVQHGLQSSPTAGRLRLKACLAGSWLEMSVSDDGRGIPPAEVEHCFFGERHRAHALRLLRRRLQAVYGRAFRLEVCSEVGLGTTVTMHIPLRTRVGGGSESKELPDEIPERSGAR
jgi:two-component system, LytTR family, sensor kinase